MIFFFNHIGGVLPGLERHGTIKQRRGPFGKNKKSTRDRSCTVMEDLFWLAHADRNSDGSFRQRRRRRWHRRLGTVSNISQRAGVVRPRRRCLPPTLVPPGKV